MRRGSFGKLGCWWADHEGSVTWYPAVTRTKEDHTSMFLVSGNTYAVLVEDEGRWLKLYL